MLQLQHFFDKLKVEKQGGNKMLENIAILKDFTESEKKNLFNTLLSKPNYFTKNAMIAYSLNNTDLIGIIIQGEGQILRYDYNGSRTVIDTLKPGSIFSNLFLSTYNSEVIVTAITDCEVIFFSYEELKERCQKGSPIANHFLINLFQIVINQNVNQSERIELLTKRSIRDKLLTYFNYLSRKYSSKSFDLNTSYTLLADYLAVDRSALMRELKHLKEEGFIKEVNKRITLIS